MALGRKIMLARRSTIRCIGAGVVAYLIVCQNAAGQDELLLEVEPIEVQLTESQRQLLTTAAPVALAATTDIDRLTLSWESGRLGPSLDAMDAFRIELHTLPTSSIAVENATVALLENWWGVLEIERSAAAEKWVLSPANYQMQLGKINSLPDRRVIPLLPIKLSLENSSQVAFGHLAIFCARHESGLLRCDDLKFVFSDAAAKDRDVEGTVEQVLTSQMMR
jgi:hypothetical protein